MGNISIIEKPYTPKEIVDIAQKYKTEMTFADRLKFSRLLEKFQEHN